MSTTNSDSRAKAIQQAMDEYLEHYPKEGLVIDSIRKLPESSWNKGQKIDYYSVHSRDFRLSKHSHMPIAKLLEFDSYNIGQRIRFFNYWHAVAFRIKVIQLTKEFRHIAGLP